MVLVVFLLVTLLEKIFSQLYFLDLRRSRNVLVHGKVLVHRHVLVGWKVLGSRNVLGSGWVSSVYQKDFHSLVASGVRREAAVVSKMVETGWTESTRLVASDAHVWRTSASLATS